MCPFFHHRGRFLTSLSLRITKYYLFYLPNVMPSVLFKKDRNNNNIKQIKAITISKKIISHHYHFLLLIAWSQGHLFHIETHLAKHMSFTRTWWYKNLIIQLFPFHLHVFIPHSFRTSVTLNAIKPKHNYLQVYSNPTPPTHD